MFTEDETARKEFYDSVINTGLLDEWYGRVEGRVSDSVYIGYFNDALVVLGGVPDEAGNVALFTAMMPDLLRLARGKDARIGVGISDACERVRALEVAYAQAMSVLKTGGSLNRSSFVDA